MTMSVIENGGDCEQDYFKSPRSVFHRDQRIFDLMHRGMTVMQKGKTSSCNVLALTPACLPARPTAQHHTTPAGFLSIDVLRTKLITKHPVLKTVLNTILIMSYKKQKQKNYGHVKMKVNQ